MRFRFAACNFLMFVCAVGVAQSGVTSPIGAAVPGRFLIVYREDASEAATTQVIPEGYILQRKSPLGFAVVRAISFAAADPAVARQVFAQQPGVEFVVQDRLVSASALMFRSSSVLPAGMQSADFFYYSAAGWAVRQVGGFGSVTAPGRGLGPWDTTRGAGVRIAILDSGIDARHPDLAPNLAFNVAEVDQSALPSPCDDGSPQDQQGHGSWVASLAAGALGEGTGMVAGVAPAATLLNIKVLERRPSATVTPSDPTGCSAGEASGLLSWVLAGIEEAVHQHAGVISMSLGTLVDVSSGDGVGIKAVFDRVTHAATQAGAILIAAAGNDGLNLSNSHYVELPAQSQDVLAIVAATNPDCAEDLSTAGTCKAGAVTLPYYSNFGPTLNALAAPGGSYPPSQDINPGSASGWIEGACSAGEPDTLDGAPVDATHSMGCFALGHAEYVQAMGTSASAPLAAGVAALLRAAHPTWGAASVMQAMHASGLLLPSLPVPMLNAAAALRGESGQGQPGAASPASR